MGERFDGRIYQSKTKGCEYCQITIRGFDGDDLSELPLGHQLAVQIVEAAQSAEAHVQLSHCDP
jgi:hypothetical protein